MEIKIKKITIKYGVLIGISCFGLIFLLNTFITISGVGVGNMNIWTIFLTGLITGGLTCLAVQGGLLAATIAQRQEANLLQKTKETDTILPILSFLGAKLIAYTLLGLLLGWLGSFFTLTLHAQVIMQFLVAIFMLGTALQILDVHPIFRYFVIQPPKVLTRLIRKQSKSTDVFAPSLLGAFTVFIPCGTTQAMMALAIASGSPISGAAVLFAFILGTSPLFFLLGYFATKLGESLQRTFMKFAAVAIILLALFNIHTALALSGIGIALPFWGSTNSHISLPDDEAVISNATITITAERYEPASFTVKAGSNVTLTLKNVSGQSCIQSFTIPKLGLQKIVPVGTSDTITFTAPKTHGELPFMCSMGMYRGVIHVI